MDFRMIGAVIVGIGVVDFLVGHFVVVPRVRDEAARPKVRLALASASLLTIALGTTFLLGWIRGI